MKKLWIFCAASALLLACGNNENDTGDRTYDLKTMQDSAETPIGGNRADTTPTTNNNIYNPDSLPGKGTAYDTAAERKVPGQPPLQ